MQVCHEHHVQLWLITTSSKLSYTLLFRKHIDSDMISGPALISVELSALSDYKIAAWETAH